MELTWLGGGTVLARGRDARVLINPPEDPSFLQSVRGGVDLVVRSDGQANALRPVTGPQVLARPGEYEVRGITVRGVAVGDAVVFVCDVDEVGIGATGNQVTAISEDEQDALGKIDVLILPVGGGPGPAPAAAARLVARLQPSVVVPVQYATGLLEEAGLAGLEPFASEMGMQQWTAQPKLTLTGSPGVTDETRVVVLELRR
ncbi:MAG TPA: MBL fold metallo-hydrolase [Candidatus Dormibacteraeota bacterium]|nr:MBL fold metallo-hydrolase [Candidatus Dormibacteraeota bacterium]